MTDPLLSVEQLSILFPGHGHVVKDLSFDIMAGQTLGMVGESGSGKSMTSLAIMGLVPHSGQVSGQAIRFKGDDLLQWSDKQLRPLRGNRISMVFQEPMTSLNPVFQVGTQVGEVLRTHKKMNKKQAVKRTIELFDWVGIPEPQRRIKSYPHQLSGGQKQRVMIAMAIACQPDLLICDEPTTALDVTIQQQVLTLLNNLQKELGMAMLFITHDLGVVAEVADDVIVMCQGEQVEQGKTHDIFERPKQPYTQGLLACRPKLDDNPRRLLTVSDFVDNKVNEPVQGSTEPMAQAKAKKSTQGTPLLEVHQLHTHFPIKGGLLGRTQGHVKAVDGVNLTIHKGETLGLVGESGSGKTTLGRTLLRLQQATSGQVTFDGVDVFQQSAKAMRALRSKMQIIFQDPYASLNPRMTAGATLLEPIQIHQADLDRGEQEDQVVSWLEQVGLRAEDRFKYPHEFSGGQRQRICIARALAVKPEFIVCDESVSALDVSVQAQVLNLLLDLQEQHDLTYLFISHDLSVINFIADRVAVMQQGQLVETGAVNDVYQNPQHPYTQKLIDAIPKFGI